MARSPSKSSPAVVCSATDRSLPATVTVICADTVGAPLSAGTRRRAAGAGSWPQGAARARVSRRRRARRHGLWPFDGGAPSVGGLSTGQHPRFVAFRRLPGVLDDGVLHPALGVLE